MQAMDYYSMNDAVYICYTHVNIYMYKQLPLAWLLSAFEYMICCILWCLEVEQTHFLVFML